MAEAKKPDAKPADAKPGDAKPKDAKPALSPEQEANQRVTSLQEEVKRLEQEVKVLRGRFENRSPQLIAQVKRENEELKIRAQALRRASHALLLDASRPRTAEEAKTLYEALRLAAVDFCTKTKTDAELWKSIVS